MVLTQSQLSQQLDQMINSSQNESIQVVNQATISGYKVIRDIYGKPSVLIKIDQPRTTYINWYQTITTFNIIAVYI